MTQPDQRHTPGPWSVRPLEHDDWGAVRGPEGALVAWARSGRFSFPDEKELDEHRRNKTDPYAANARLIAASPDMLAALKPVQAWLETQPNAVGIPDFPKDEIDAAVMKAEGR